MPSLTHHAVLVTGSSQGIGHAIALAAHAAGAQVVFHGKETNAPARPEGCPYLAADLLAPDAASRLVQAAFAAQPDLNLLVCNAGSFFDVPFLNVTPEIFERTVNLNVRANYFLAQAFARELIARQRSGAILTTTSTNGFQPEDDSSVYDTSKGAMVMLTRTLAHSLAPHGIRVNSIAPGLIRTPLTAAMLTPERTRHYEKKIVLGRIGEPEDCAGAAVFLLSPEARYITGQILVVDGGLTLGQIGRL